MFKDVLKKQQPVVYKTLSNALKNKQLSHCYMFSGDKGTLKKETAILIGQSLVCTNKTSEFGCEQCLECQRIANGSYLDFIDISSEKNIKAEEIEELQNQFRKTALERSGKKIFIIENCDNLTISSANKLLKFIEEPTDTITGILLTSQIERVLPTIISRCQVINFKPLDKSAFYDYAKKEGIDELSCHFISNLVNSTNEISQLNSKSAYNEAIKLFCEFGYNFFKEKASGFTYLQNALSKSKSKSKSTDNREVISYFLDLCLIFCDDYSTKYSSDDETYSNLLTSALEKNFDFASFMKATIETKDALKTGANGQLVIDQLLYKLLEV